MNKPLSFCEGIGKIMIHTWPLIAHLLLQPQLLLDHRRTCLNLGSALRCRKSLLKWRFINLCNCRIAIRQRNLLGKRWRPKHQRCQKVWRKSSQIWEKQKIYIKSILKTQKAFIKGLLKTRIYTSKHKELF